MGKKGPMQRRLAVTVSRLHKLRYKTRERQGRVHVFRGRSGLTLKQLEVIYGVASRTGARARVMNVIVTKPRGKIIRSM